MGQESRLSPSAGAERGVGLVSGHDGLLSDAGQITLLPCSACLRGGDICICRSYGSLIKAAQVVAEKGACLLASACGLMLCSGGLAG